MDQNNLVFSRDVFDLDHLGTDGYEVSYALRDVGGMHAVVTDVWYNRARF